jgi:hypothetical protein
VDQAPPRTVGELAARVGGSVLGDPATRVTGVTHDSRRVGPGDLFAAIAGFERDGHVFVPEAAAAVAAAVMVERVGPWPLPAIVVPDVRAALGAASHAIWDEPTRWSWPVTGTNGRRPRPDRRRAKDRATAILDAGFAGRMLKPVRLKASDIARRKARSRRSGRSAWRSQPRARAGARRDRVRRRGIHEPQPRAPDFHGTMENTGSEARLLPQAGELDAIAASTRTIDGPKQFVAASP